MKTNAIIRIVLFSLAILLLVGILLGVLCLKMFIVDGKVQFETHDTVETPVESITKNLASSDIRNLDIEWVSGSIIILADETVSNIRIEEHAPQDTDYQMICNQSGQTLKIKFCEESIKFPSLGITTDFSKDLFITVPADWVCNSIEIDAAATDVVIQGIQMKELDFDGASGQLLLNSCQIDKLDIDTASGDVEFYGTLKELDFDAASARFTGQFYQIPQKLNLDAMSGDLTILLPEDSGFTCALDTMSGSFDSDFDFSITGASHYTCGDGACKIKISAMSGDVEIRKGISAAKNCDH